MYKGFFPSEEGRGERVDLLVTFFSAMGIFLYCTGMGERVEGEWKINEGMERGML